MDVGKTISIKKFVLLTVVSGFLFLMLLVITPPYQQDKTISYYNPETQVMDYHLKWNNWFWFGFLAYVLIVAYVGSMIAFGQRRDILHLWHAIPDTFRHKFGIPEINEVDFMDGTILKETGSTLELFTRINTHERLNKRLFMVLRMDAPEGENPVKKICTNNWALNEIRTYMRDSTSVSSLIDKLGADKSGVLTEVVKKKLNEAEENEEIS